MDLRDIRSTSSSMASGWMPVAAILGRFVFAVDLHAVDATHGWFPHAAQAASPASRVRIRLPCSIMRVRSFDVTSMLEPGSRRVT